MSHQLLSTRHRFPRHGKLPAWAAVPLLIALAAVFGGLTASRSVRALDIVLVWDDLGENPSFDANGTRLMAVANAAATIWEQLIPTPGTHTVDVSWSHLDSLGYWKFDPFGNNNLYFDSGTDWFLDPTPLVDEEFSFPDPFEYNGGNLYGTSDIAHAWFDGTTPPGSLEIGRVGVAKSTAPQAARDNLDLLGAVLHEMGHELGGAPDVLSNRFPIYPHHVSGLAGVEVVGEGGHLATQFALMWAGTSGPGTRRLPSAVDVLVAARDSNYLTVDLPRKFVGIGTDWNAMNTWIGGRVPDSSDDAYVGHGGTVTLSDAGRAENVFIHSSNVATGPHALAIDSRLSLVQGSHLLIGSGGSVTTSTIEAADSFGYIEFSGGRLNVNHGGTIVGEVITGHGTVDIGGPLLVEGRIVAQGGTLELTGEGSLDLWRTSSDSPDVRTGEVLASDGNIKLGVAVTGTTTLMTGNARPRINVSAGRRLIVTRDLTIPSTVQVGLYGTSADPAFLTSEGANTDVAIENLRVDNGVGWVLSRTLTLNGSVFVDTFGHLTLGSPVRTTLAGASLHGGGTLTQGNHWTVTGGTTNISTGLLDWGNSTSAQVNELRLLPGSTLEVTSDAVDDFHGELIVDSAVLDVEPAWLLGSANGTTPGGRLSLIHSGGGTPIIRGGRVTARDRVLVAGGDARIESDLTITSTADVVVLGGARLLLDGNTTLAGGSYTGPGALVQQGDIDVVANTTVAVETFTWGNSPLFGTNTLTVNRGDTLTINSHGTGNADNRFRGVLRLSGGTLAVNFDNPWTLPDSAGLLSEGVLELFGDIIPSRVQGQPLTVAGRIRALSGSSHVDSNVVFTATHHSEIAAGATLHLNGAVTYAGGMFTGAGTLSHNGTGILNSLSPLTAPRFVQNGELRVDQPLNLSRIQAAVIDFQPASRTRMFTDLHVSGDAIVRSGAIFEGPGTLIVDPTSRLAGTGNIGVDLDNHGVLTPGLSIGTLIVDGNFAQSSAGELEIELANNSIGGWDVLEVGGVASLGGVLRGTILGDFRPGVGELFRIMRAGGGVLGTFDSVELPPLQEGLTWAVYYNPTTVVLAPLESSTLLPGDIDLDGDVDRTDAALFTPHLGRTANSIWTTGDFNLDGRTTLVDLALLHGQYGRTLPSPTAAVPEPGSVALGWIAMFLVVAKTLVQVRRKSRF